MTSKMLLLECSRDRIRGVWAELQAARILRRLQACQSVTKYICWNCITESVKPIDTGMLHCSGHLECCCGS